MSGGDPQPYESNPLYSPYPKSNNPRLPCFFSPVAVASAEASTLISAFSSTCFDSMAALAAKARLMHSTRKTWGRENYPLVRSDSHFFTSGATLNSKFNITITVVKSYLHLYKIDWYPEPVCLCRLGEKNCLIPFANLRPTFIRTEYHIITRAIET